MIRLNDKLKNVTKDLVAFNEEVFVRLQLRIDCEVWCADYTVDRSRCLSRPAPQTFGHGCRFCGA